MTTKPARSPHYAGPIEAALVIGTIGATLFGNWVLAQVDTATASETTTAPDPIIIYTDDTDSASGSTAIVLPPIPTVSAVQPITIPPITRSRSSR